MQTNIRTVNDGDSSQVRIALNVLKWSNNVWMQNDEEPSITNHFILIYYICLECANSECMEFDSIKCAWLSRIDTFCTNSIVFLIEIAEIFSDFCYFAPFCKSCTFCFPKLPAHRVRALETKVITTVLHWHWYFALSCNVFPCRFDLYVWIDHSWIFKQLWAIFAKCQNSYC